MTQLPVFETARLILRDITERDAPAYERHFVDYEVIRTMSHIVPWPYLKGGVLEYIRTDVIPRQCKDQWAWGICLRSAPDELIGRIWLKRKCTPSNRGFWLGKKFWGKGIMTEAVKPVTDYAFNVLGFEKLVLGNAVGNTASRRIKERMGAVFLRTEPAIYVDPSYTEREVWELTKECWKAFWKNSVSHTVVSPPQQRRL
jgi:RimJ/RimL family protein N-acetyltransferase